MEATATQTTPTTTSGAIAAPATSAPSSSPTPSERPRTLTEAFARDAAATSTAPVNDAAAATVQPQATTDESGATTTTNTTDAAKPTGEPPQERWPQILDNARAKAKDEALAEWRQQYGWAEQLPRETLQEWTGIAQRMSSDPIGFLNELQAEIANHPTFGPQLRSHAARTLASGRGQQAPDLSPDLVVDDGNGRQITTFSAERVQQIVQHAIADAMQKEVGPIKQTYEQQQKAQKAAEAHRVLEAKADEVLADITAIVGEDDEAISAVATTMEKNPSWSAQRAAAHVHRTVLLPKLQGKAQSKVLDDLKTKAAASTVNPASAVVASTRKPTSLLDKDLVW